MMDIYCTIYWCTQAVYASPKGLFDVEMLLC